MLDLREYGQELKNLIVNEEYEEATNLIQKGGEGLKELIISDNEEFLQFQNSKTQLLNIIQYNFTQAVDKR
jgi:hypothetical protein